MGLGFPEAAEGVNERTGQSGKKKKAWVVTGCKKVKNKVLL